MQKLLLSLLGGVGMVLFFYTMNATSGKPMEFEVTGAAAVQFLVGTLALYIFVPARKKR